MVSESGGTEEDIVSRIRKAQQAFATLRSVWKSRVISLNTKLRIFNSNIKSVLLYGSETWRLTKALLSKVQSFLNKKLRQIIGIFWPNVITNEELWGRTGQEDVETTIKRRKWKWIGHTLRKAPNNTTRMAMEWNPQGRRSRGRPKQSWRRTVSKELENIGRTWGEAKLLANNKIRWKLWWKPYASRGAKRIKSSHREKSCWMASFATQYTNLLSFSNFQTVLKSCTKTLVASKLEILPIS